MDEILWHRRETRRHRENKPRPVAAGASGLLEKVVSAAVLRALRRAGIESPISGAYVLRHTAASRLVRQGTPLKEVADLLGHRCLDTTTIYAKVDVPALQQVALPWPEVTHDAV
jgi:integrase/recombinase XerD